MLYRELSPHGHIQPIEVRDLYSVLQTLGQEPMFVVVACHTTGGGGWGCFDIASPSEDMVRTITSQYADIIEFRYWNGDYALRVRVNQGGGL